ncbi:MAG TPA: glycoside hydrolase family 30 beta sandwich domain-containing protein [Gemmatimonadaceae bacterium]
MSFPESQTTRASHHVRAPAARALGAGVALALAACSGSENLSTAASACFANLGAPSGSSAVTIDPSSRFQTMQGFGTTERLFDDPHVTETFDQATQRAAVIPPAADQAKILDALYGGIGLTRVRVHPDPIEPVNDNADPNVADLSKFDFSWKGSDGYIASIKTLLPRGVTTYFASPITIEPWMNTSNPAEYAEWVIVMLRHWRDQGLEMPYYSIINEPGFTRSGIWPGTWMRDVIKILGPRLTAEGLKTKLVVPDDIDPMQALGRLQVILADPAARQYVGAVAYHLYNRGGEAQVKQLAGQYGLPIWMTEFSTGSDWFQWATIMQQLIADDGVSAVDYLWGYFGDWDTAQLIRIRVNNGAYAGFDFNKQYYVMGQYSKYVRPGAVRIGATSAQSDVKLAAFLEGSQEIVVATNTGSQQLNVSFELGSGSCLTRVDATRTSETEGLQALPTITLDQSRFSATLPAKSVTTFVGR